MHLPASPLAAALALALAGSAAAEGFHGVMTILRDDGSGKNGAAEVQLALENSSTKYVGWFRGFKACPSAQKCLVWFEQSDGGGQDAFEAILWEDQGCEHINFQDYHGWEEGGCCGPFCQVNA